MVQYSKLFPIEWAKDLKLADVKSVNLTKASGDSGFDFDDSAKCVTIHWGGYEYHIHYERIDTPQKAIGWLFHLSDKDWGADFQKLVLLTELANKFGWQRHAE